MSGGRGNKGAALLALEGFKAHTPGADRQAGRAFLLEYFQQKPDDKPSSRQGLNNRLRPSSARCARSGAQRSTARTGAASWWTWPVRLVSAESAGMSSLQHLRRSRLPLPQRLRHLPLLQRSMPQGPPATAVSAFALARVDRCTGRLKQRRCRWQIQDLGPRSLHVSKSAIIQL